MFEIRAEPIEVRAVEAAVVAPAQGAVVTFAGVVRNHSQGKPVSYLEYDAYAPLAVKAFEQIAEEVHARWSAPCAIVHRVGRLEIGEASVVIAVAAAHRHDAFAACQYAIDRLKQLAPIWKKEVTPAGDWWVEGDALHPCNVNG